MIFHFKKNVDACGPKCHDNFKAQVVALCPEFSPGVNAHISISHGKPNHTFWVTFYNLGYHENWVESKDGNGISVQTKFNKTQKKYTGKLPDLKDLKKLF